MRYVVIAILGVVSCAEQGVAADSPVCIVDGRVYNHRALFGATRRDLREEFQREIASWSDADLLAHLGRRDVGEAAGKATRAALRPMHEDALFETVYHRALQQVCRFVVISHITQRIVEQHNVSLDEYFEIPVIKDALARQARYLGFVYQHAHAPPGDYKRLYATLQQPEYRTSLTWEEFVSRRANIATVPFYAKWPLAVFMSPETVPEHYLRASLAHYLLRDACERGVYSEMGRREYELRHSGIVTVTVTGYEGRPESLEAFFNAVIDQEGNVARDGIRGLQSWMHRLQIPVSVSSEITGFRHDMAVTSVPGVLYRTSDRTYEIFGWISRAQDPTDPMHRNAYRAFVRDRAFQLAARRYMPSFKSLVPGWEPDVARLATISLSGASMMFLEVRSDEFIKQVYPAEAFDDIERHSVAIQELTLAAVSAVLSRHAADIAQVRARIEAEKNRAKTEAVKHVYGKLEAQIEAETAAQTKKVKP